MRSPDEDPAGPPAAVTLRRDGRPSRARSSEVHNFLRAEFSALRAEIDRRSNAQQTLMALYVTGVGLISAAAVRGGLGLVALLILPFLGWAISTLYVDHHMAIVEVGVYIDETCQGRLGVGQNWESWSRGRRNRPKLVFARWRAGPYLIFFATSLTVVTVMAYFVWFDVAALGLDPVTTLALASLRAAWVLALFCVVMTGVVLSEMGRRVPDDR